ncbi:MAG: hypothetical protein RSH52_06665, partial [Janthinobacterium sp.]
APCIASGSVRHKFTIISRGLLNTKKLYWFFDLYGWDTLPFVYLCHWGWPVYYYISFLPTGKLFYASSKTILAPRQPIPRRRS